MKNPFRYGMRVGGCDFFDRTKIMRDIRNTLDGGNNAPYYLQALGSWTFNATTGRNGRSISQADVDEGFDSLYSAERILLENTFIAHPQSQRLLMRALATEPTATFPEDYRCRHALASTSTVNTALRRLIAESTVDHQDGRYLLSDPILAYHLAKNEKI